MAHAGNSFARNTMSSPSNDGNRGGGKRSCLLFKRQWGCAHHDIRSCVDYVFGCCDKDWQVVALRLRPFRAQQERELRSVDQAHQLHWSWVLHWFGLYTPSHP